MARLRCQPLGARAQSGDSADGQAAPGHEHDVLRLSHRLVALHAGGIVTLILVVLGTALWISREHNRLALKSSQRLIQNEIEAMRSSTYTLVRDYSLWNEGFAAVVEDDREWLFSSIGSSVTDLDTFDLAILVPRGHGPTSAGSPARRPRARSTSCRRSCSTPSSGSCRRATPTRLAPGR